MIRNIVFDIGNVLVRWDPVLIIERTFGKERTNEKLVRSIFPGNDIWIPLNLGRITAAEAMLSYRETLGFSEDETELLWHNVLDSQSLISETVEMMENLSNAGFRIFALSDNVHEIVRYLKSHYEFWDLFDGAVISAEVGMLKPEEPIFRHLLSRFDLKADETVFMDDVPKNVSGAKALGIRAFQFTTADAAKEKLTQMGISFG